MKANIIRIDPYHPVLGALVHPLCQRIQDCTEDLGGDQGTIISGFFAQLWGRSPSVLLLAAVDPKTGHLKGFCAASRVGEGEVTMLQPRLDEPAENDAIAEMVTYVEEWTKSQNVHNITLVTKRSDPKWLKKYGFTVQRYVMGKEV